jgi:hypothetical protein
MSHAQVERTLVKSPPELWAELSNPASLARHLGELGEIRITRIEPEHKLEWTADGASGSVLLKPSGWGTRVTLTARRQTEDTDTVEPAAGTQAAAAAQRQHPPAIATSQPVTALLAAPPAPGAPARAAEQLPPAAAQQPPRAAADQAPAVTPAQPASTQMQRQPRIEQPKPALDPTPQTPAPSEPAATPDPPAGAPAAQQVARETVQHPRPRLFERLLARLGRRRQPDAPLEPAPAAPATPPPATAVLCPGAPDSVPAEAASRPATANAEHAAVTQTPPPTEVSARAPSAPMPGSPAVFATTRALDDQPAVPGASVPPAGPPVRGFEPPAPPPDNGPAPTADGPPASPAQPPASPAEPPARDDAADEDVAAVLRAVLDNLGSAHHRPFSRP